MMPLDPMQAEAQTWLDARNIILGVLQEICPSYGQERNEHFAACILARLANHKPPLLVATLEQIKD